MDITSSQNLDLIINEFYSKVCDRSDKDVANKIISKNVEFFPVGSNIPIGFDDFYEYVSTFQKSLKFSHTIKEYLAGERKVFIHWEVNGKHEGELLGFAPTNLNIKYSGMSIFELFNNQIVKATTSFDEKTLIEQLSSSSR